MNTPPELLPPNSSEHRRKGKIGRLPKKQRDLINQMLDDGATYAEIIKKLNEEGVSLNQVNLSHWQHGGHQDWLKEQIWREEIHSRHEAYSDLLADGQSATRLPEAALQLATTEICRRLHEITLTAQALDGTSDPNSFTRLVHSLCRLSREVLHLQKYHDSLKAAKEGEGKRFDAFRELTEAERQAILDKADDIFGCRAYRNLPPLPLQPASEGEGSWSSPLSPLSPLSPSLENQPATSPRPVIREEHQNAEPSVPSVPCVLSVPSVPLVPSSPPVENQANVSPLPIRWGEGQGEGASVESATPVENQANTSPLPIVAVRQCTRPSNQPTPSTTPNLITLFPPPHQPSSNPFIPTPASFDFCAPFF